MKVCLLLAAVCVGAVLGRPGLLPSEPVQLKQLGNVPELSNVKPNLPEELVLDDKTKKTGDSSTWNFWDKVKIDMLSLGRLDNDPGTGGDLAGELFHRLTFGFGDDDYKVYLEHHINGFSGDNAGDLSLGYESPIWKIGDVSIRASQGIGGSGNGTFDWRLNLNDNQF